MDQNDRDALAAAMIIKAYCYSRQDYCNECIFLNNNNYHCEFDYEPENWDLKKIERQMEDE